MRWRRRWPLSSVEWRGWSRRRHREGPLETVADFSDNGLVAALPHGIAIRSGQETGSVSVNLAVVEKPPTQNLFIWDEVGEVSWQEDYEVTVWRAPAAKPVVHKHSDRLGYVLRGEPVPPVAVVPDEL